MADKAAVISGWIDELVGDLEKFNDGVAELESVGVAVVEAKNADLDKALKRLYGTFGPRIVRVMNTEFIGRQKMPREMRDEIVAGVVKFIGKAKKETSEVKSYVEETYPEFIDKFASIVNYLKTNADSPVKYEANDPAAPIKGGKFQKK